MGAAWVVFPRMDTWNLFAGSVEGSTEHFLLLSLAIVVASSLVFQAAASSLIRRLPLAERGVQGALLAGVLSALLFALGGESRVGARVALLGSELPHAFGLGLRLDRTSALMFALTGFLGWIVFRFACRYLRSEAERPRFLQVLGLTILLVQGFVLSTNLLGHALLWLGISVCVHRLLRHYEGRWRARVAARKKFLFSRLGDLFFWSALVLLAQQLGTLDLVELAVQVQKDASDSWRLELAAACLVSAALLKSAQFPFHSWLPGTLESPTPVSAVLHAGVINAGAFLLLMCAPLLEGRVFALGLLVGVGGFTAAFGTIVGAVQSSRKQVLAWSTIAQMGFLFFEIGLGFVGAAALHLVAHAVYKAHAFLRSGTLEPEPQAATVNPRMAVVAMAGSLALTLGLLSVVSNWVTDALDYWPLAAVWALGLSQYLIGPSTISLGVRMRAYLIVGGTMWGVAAWAEHEVARWLHELSPFASHGPGPVLVVVLCVALLGGVLFLCALRSWRGPVLEPLYTHALAGFYVGEWFDHLTESIWSDERYSGARVPASPP